MYDRILVPLDASQPAQRGLREAMAIGKAMGARLTLLHVVDDFSVQLERAPAAAFEQSLERMRARGNELLATAREAVAHAGLQVETVLREIEMQSVADAILEQIGLSDCQLVVMGTHGRRGMNRLAMGSDAELVLRASPVPVLLVRNDDKTH